MTAETNLQRFAYGGHNLLGGFASMLLPTRRVGSEYDAVRQELLDFIRETVSICGKCIVFGHRLAQTHVGLVEASNRLKRNQMQTKSVLTHFSGNTDRTVTVFSTDVVESARLYLQDLQWPKEACKLLGVYPAALLQLVDQGLIAHDQLYPQLLPGSLPRYSKAVLQRLLDAALGMRPVPSSAGLCYLFKATQRARVTYGDIVALLVSGKLKHVYYDHKLHGLKRIMVDPVEVASHFKIESGWMLSDEVAALIGIPIREVQIMAREKLLNGHKLKRMGYPHTTMFFEQDEVTRFHQAFVAVSALGKQAKLTTVTVGRRLRKAEIPCVRAKQLTFYERAAAEAEIAKL